MLLTKSYATIATSFAVLLIFPEQFVKASLTKTPEDRVALVGHSTYFNCSTSIYDRNVYWYFYPVGRSLADRKDIAENEIVYESYKDKYRIDHFADGVFNLVLISATLEDAGRYECQDDGGFGDQKSAELVVLEEVPTCSSSSTTNEVIGPNSCGIEPEELRLSCSIMYKGKTDLPPFLEWKSAKENKSGITFEDNGSTLTYHLTTMADLIYTCPATKTRVQHFRLNCNSNVIHVLYAFNNSHTVNASVGDEIVCVANTSQNCHYKWKWFKGEDSTTESNSATLVPKKLGLHKCEATCDIKTRSCTILAMKVHVFVSLMETEQKSSAADTYDSPGVSSGAVIGIAIAVVFLTGLVGLVVGLIIWWKTRKRNEMLDERTNADSELKSMMPKNEILDELNLNRITTPSLFLSKGNSGEFYGPWEWNKKPCVWQKILIPPQTKDIDKPIEICERVEKWKKLDHNNLITFHYVRFQLPVLYILMDYAEGGTVRKVLDDLVKSEMNLSDEVVNNWAIQIAEGMNYLHEHDILHGHLQCGQVFVMKTFDHSGTTTNVLKIGSFRIAVLDSKSEPSVNRHMFAWMSPEVLKGETYLQTSDIWSYGVTIWEILTQGIPYKGVKFGTAVTEICNGSKSLPIPDSCSSGLQELLKDCFNHNWDERPTFRSILSKLQSIHTGCNLVENDEYRHGGVEV